MTGQEIRPHVLVVHPGGLGDLVLLSELIASLKQAHPERAVTLICRSEFTSIVDCYPAPPDEVVGLPFQPYSWAEPREEFNAFFRPMLSRFGRARAAVLVDAALRPNWLAEFLAAGLEPDCSIRCGVAADRVGQLPEMLKRFGLSRQPFRDLELPARTHERDRYRLLAEALDSSFIPAMPWRMPEGWKQQSLAWLGERGIEPRKYLSCAPFGAASTPIKRWPIASFTEVLHRFFKDSEWPVLLMGDHAEHKLLAGVDSLLCDVHSFCFAGRPEELPLAAGLLSMAGAYLANDSGLMHLAQAYGVPGAAIFGGGGEWPAYAPWAHGSAGLCHPLPCFGCQWDCFLGHGLCVESVTVEKVHETLSAVCQAPKQAPRNVILDTLGEPLIGLVADASARYREVQQDRSARLEVIVELERSRREWAARESELDPSLVE